MVGTATILSCPTSTACSCPTMTLQAARTTPAPSSALLLASSFCCSSWLLRWSPCFSCCASVSAPPLATTMTRRPPAAGVTTTRASTWPLRHASSKCTPMPARSAPAKARHRCQVMVLHRVATTRRSTTWSCLALFRLTPKQTFPSKQLRRGRSTRSCGWVTQRRRDRGTTSCNCSRRQRPTTTIRRSSRPKRRRRSHVLSGASVVARATDCVEGNS
mmetsp:Transcript_9512/g.22634  ORF Transcript_9512/g.22634 Transcript_9512/m.22634 type:complete len:217 (-) Transcript_9512:107-757(-)